MIYLKCGILFCHFQVGPRALVGFSPDKKLHLRKFKIRLIEKKFIPVYMYPVTFSRPQYTRYRYEVKFVQILQLKKKFYTVNKSRKSIIILTTSLHQFEIFYKSQWIGAHWVKRYWKLLRLYKKNSVHI